MGGKTAIALGLVLGVIAGAGLLVAVLAFAPRHATPQPTRPPLATLPPPMASPVASVAPVGPGASDGAASSSDGESPPNASAATPNASAATPNASATAAPGSPGASGSAVAGTPDPLFGVGEPAPPLSVPGLDGGKVDLASLRGSPVWVNFMATWCLPCRDELPLMAGYAARYQDDGLSVLLVDEREDAATLRAFLANLGVSFPAGLDQDGSALADWGALALPVHFWVGSDGVIRDAALGGIGPDVMARGLGAILPGVTVTP